MDEDEKFSPYTKPVFLDKDRAKESTYVGSDITPEFDAELEPLPDLGEGAPPLGKGASRGYETRYRLIARYHAEGYTNNQIATKLGYSAPGVSNALGHPFVQAEIKRWREALFSQDTMDIVKDTAREGALAIKKIISNPDTKESTLLAASQWAVEKATGKAKQEISHESGTLNTFMDLLKQMQGRGEVLDVTPQAPILTVGPESLPEAQKEPDWSEWIDQHVK